MEYSFSDLVDLSTLQNFFNSLFSATSINCSIIDMNSSTLIESGSIDICSKFHKVNPLTFDRCANNLASIIDELKTGESYISRKCPNGLTSIGIPIKIEGQYCATLYFGQFLTEKPDESFFSEQCSYAGFDRTEYMRALYDTPILSEERMNSIIALLIRLCNVMSKLGEDSLQQLQWNARLDVNYKELEATYEELVATEEELRAQFEALQYSQEKLRKSEERYKLALLGSHDGIWDWDIKNSSFYYSEKWAAMLGYTKANLPIANISWVSFIHPEDIVVFNNEMDNYLSRKSEKYKCEYRLRTAEGSYIWVSDVGAATWNEGGIPVRMVGSHTDITEQKKWSEKIQKMAYYDSLTELPNKFSLYRDLNSLCKQNYNFSVLFMDLDNFKSVNDLLSHNFGDELLKALSLELRSLFSDNCTIYRWGGDEFVLIVKDIKTEEELTQFIDSIIELLEKPIIVDGCEQFITASIGACLYPRDSKIPEDLIKHSDMAMYQAKNLGKNNYHIYNPSILSKILEQATLERELRYALKNNEFRVYYQPRIDIKSNKLVGMEALLRWVKPDGTIISPVIFIPKAEETGLIIPIGEFVIKEACAQLKQWESMGYKSLVVSINLSPKQIEDRNLMNVIKQSLKETELNPSHIELEITESAAIKDMNQTIALLKDLKELGINVLLDDFGTGYSSLNFLRLLPVTTIKIDKSFIDKVEDDTAEKIIVKSLISLAHDIRMRVIAEGIETNSQLGFLKEHYCDEAQGFYFSKPIPPKEFEELLKVTKRLN
jgi:PAS domain S-box/diguanylate cyclase (GGDEF) domain